MAPRDQATNNVRLRPIGAPLQMFRKPQRVSVTIPEAVYDYLVKRSADEGRSISNLAAYLLEMASQEAA